jgi:hypothetical protein
VAEQRLSLIFNGEKFFSRRGLLDLLEAKQESEPLYPPLHYRSDTSNSPFRTRAALTRATIHLSMARHE